MSASFFDTIMVADARTNPENSRGAQYAAPGTQQPRWTATSEPGSWVSVHVNAETALHIAAQTIADTPMDGISGDQPERRHHIITIIDAVSQAVRELALDADGDSQCTEEDWVAAIKRISDAAAIPFPVANNRRHDAVTIVR